ncbi:MAG TPA: hypothetical protein VGR10_05725, partial [Thermoleophilaceae bacterium]|nr:hypothetical protein [Thermoleophilaceae bacterium]
SGGRGARREGAAEEDRRHGEAERDPADRGPSAAERLADLDPVPERRESRPAGSGPPPSARTGSRYAWVVGLAVFVLIAGAVYTSLFSGPVGEGFRGIEPGTPAPDFALPTPTSDVEGDANVIQRRDAEAASVPPACEVREAGVVTVCGAPFRPLAVTFVTTGCEAALDRVESVRADFPDVRFVAVYSDESPAEVADLMASRGWGFEVAVDPDRPEVFNLYRAGDCPTTVLVERGGDVERTVLGPLSEGELRAALRDLTAPSPGRPAA